MQVAADLSGWLADQGLSAWGLSCVRIEAFTRYRRACGRVRGFTPKGLAPILEPLRAWGAVPLAESPREYSAVGRLLREYETYLLQERGLRRQTVAGYLGLASRFVESQGVTNLSRLKHLSTSAVSRFVLTEARSSTAAYLKLKLTQFRSFLRYLHVRGLCHDLVGAVPAVARYRLQGLPKAISQEEVRQLLESCNRTTPTGLRDFAILLLLSRLGLRAAEVAALHLDDVRWSGGEIVIKGKGSDGLLPLAKDIGEALADYVMRGRPDSASGSLFLQVRAPYGDLAASTVGSVVSSASRRVSGTSMGAHRLRHTAATSMLRGGASLPEIAQVLRHRRLDTTAIYAKVDSNALRTVARRWIGGAS